MADNNQPELVEVDTLEGFKVKLPKDEAQRVIERRDALKADQRKVHEELGKLRAEKDAESAKARKAEEDRVALEHASKGEVDKTREVLTREHRKEMERLTEHLRDTTLKAAVAAMPKVVPAAVNDIVDQLRSRSRYDTAEHAVVVLDEAGQPLRDDAGKPVRVDAWLPGWLATRTHYLLNTTPKGSGGERPHQPKNARTAKRSEFGKSLPKDIAAQVARGELVLED